MSGVIFLHTLWRGWRTALYWGIGFALYGLYVSVTLSDSDVVRQYGEIMRSFPSGLLQALGAPTDFEFIGTPEGFISFGYFGYSLILLAVYLLLSGLNITANDEDQGIIDVLLSLPLPRWRVIIEKYLAYSLLTLVIIVLGLVGLWIGGQQAAVPVDFGRVIESTINMIPSALLILAFTAFAGGIARSRNTAAALASAFVIISYFLNILSSAAEGSIAEQLGRLSLFYYYDNMGVMRNGLAAGTMIGLLAVTVLLVGVGVWAFQRRDVGV